MKVKINMIDDTAEFHAPSRKHYNDAGADVYTSVDETILPHTTVAIPLALA